MDAATDEQFVEYLRAIRREGFTELIDYMRGQVGVFSGAGDEKSASEARAWVAHWEAARDAIDGMPDDVIFPRLKPWWRRLLRR